MRVYVSVDMEGVAGVVHVDQVRAEGQDYPRARELMTDEANAAALGAFDAGAAEVVINDSHADMRNLLFDRLDPPYRLQMRFHNGGMADAAGVMPGVSRADGTTLRYEARDVEEMSRALISLTRLSEAGILQVRGKQPTARIGTLWRTSCRTPG